MTDLGREAWRRLDQGLATGVGSQILDGFDGVLAEGMSLKVHLHQLARLDERVGQEDLEEEAELLAALLQKGRLRIAKEPLFREGGHSVGTADGALDHCLELSQRGVAVLDVERNVARAHDLDRVDCVALGCHLKLNHGDFVVDWLHAIIGFVHHN